MQLSFETLADKIRGCWQGKNIGGILGAPFEGYRQINDVKFYTQDLEKGLPPNDDLDLQLVWLNAVEKFGRGVNASILGDYWLTFIIPDWVEYGSGKANMRAGLLPPLSGHVENSYKDSCGCYIRSEIWACLCAGHPELAARYAYEDAIVDHAGEGMYAEIFCAAIQAAAFVESDKWKLIEIGLSYIPADCAVRKAVDTAIAAYEAGKPFTDARDAVLRATPGNFGVQHTLLRDIKDDYEYGTPGFDAPSNIGIMVIGWLYGEDDFGKSLCMAVNCGEDTDCTAATLGAIFGIIYGESGLPTEWIDPIGGKIISACVHPFNGLEIPTNVEELSDRVLRLIPSFLGHKACDILCDGRGFVLETGEELLYQGKNLYHPLTNGLGHPKELSIEELLAQSPYGVRFDFTTFYAVLDYMDEPYIKLNEPRKLRLILRDSGLTGQQQWANITIYTPDGVQILQGKHFSMPLQNTYQYKAVLEFDVLVEQFYSNKVDLLIDVAISGRHTFGVVKASLYPAG